MLLPQEHTVLVRQTSRWSQIFLLSLVGVGATAFATAWFYHLDEIITVPGRLVPQKGGVEVKSPLNAQLSKILIKDGELVKKGQTILNFDVRNAESQKNKLTKQLLIESKRIKDQQASNAQRQLTAERNINLTKRILRKMAPLRSGGAISEIQILQQENNLETQRDELMQLQKQNDELINNSLTRQAELQGELELIKNQLRNKSIQAPISGTVFDLRPDSDNYVATNAEPLLKIVPAGSLGAQVNISNKDIGFIRPGQAVKVRVDSFPYSEYGEIDGEIKNIGADALAPTNIIRSYHFPVGLKLNKSNLITRDGIIIPLQAGMTITTNIKLRDRRLIELLSDLFKNRGDSLKRLRQP